MPGEGGEAIRAVFQAAQEEAAQAAEDTGQAIAKFTNQTTENVLDSVQAIENADAASADAAKGIGESAKGGESGSGGQSKIAKMLRGDDPRLKPGTPEYERYINELAADPAKGGRIKPSSIREATVGVQAEADGDLPGPLTRAPFDADGKDVGEFVDSTGQHWDVKSSPDITPDYSKAAGQPVRKTDEVFTGMVNKELGQGIKVLLDPHGMTATRLAHLRELVANNPSWQGKVLWGK